MHRRDFLKLSALVAASAVLASCDRLERPITRTFAPPRSQAWPELSAADFLALNRLTFGPRVRPFVLAGGGYLRQLYDERTLVETGSLYYAGAGVRYWLRGGDGQRRSVGLRADGRAQWRRDGVEFEGKTRVAPVVTLHLFLEL